MKRLNLQLFALAILSLFAFSCSSDDDDDDNNNGPSGPTPTSYVTDTSISISNGSAVYVQTTVRDFGQGTGTRTWTRLDPVTGKPQVYLLDGFVFVNPGQTLTIEAGAVIKGKSGQGAEASALVVAKGATINAAGTAALPIIFTAANDNLYASPNTPASPNLPANIRGLWGGVIVLGDAPINTSSGTAQIEGIPTSENRGQYGGTNSSDNSGIMRYVSIRHGATNIGAGNEINGLTMGGVGSGTTIEYIEVFAFDDDGFEWFGGTVNSKYLASIYNQDDSYDWDFGWRGQNQFWLALQAPGFTESDRGFESDGWALNNPTASVFSLPTIHNLTLVGQGTGGSGAGNAAFFFTEGSGVKLYNSVIGNFRNGLQTNNAGTPNDIADRIADGDFVIGNSIWFGLTSSWTGTDINQVVASTATNGAALQTMLSGNSNDLLANAPFSGLTTPFDPKTTGVTKTATGIPTASVNGFTYSAVTYVGAFDPAGTGNWLQGWSAADRYNVLL